MSSGIGNIEQLALDLVPVTPSWELRFGAESAGWAGLAIWIGGHNLCSHVEPGSTQIKQHLFVPLGPLANWLVRSFPALAFEERARDFPTGSFPHRDARQWGKVRPPAGYDLAPVVRGTGSLVVAPLRSSRRRGGATPGSGAPPRR